MPKNSLTITLRWVDLIESKHIHWEAEHKTWDHKNQGCVYWYERGTVLEPTQVVHAVGRYYKSELRDDEHVVKFITIPSPEVRGGTSLAHKICTMSLPLTIDEMQKVGLTYDQFLKNQIKLVPAA
jgi:hypothetical protein